jgi:UDP-glucose 4-epimerase
MKALVTGGAGFIGSNLVAELFKQGVEITVLDNFSTGSPRNLEGLMKKIKVIKAPCSRILDLDINPPDVIFHFGIPSSSPMYRENPELVGKSIDEFIKIFEFAKHTKAKVIYASTSSLYRGCEKPYREDMQTKPFDYYTEARLAMERLAQVYHQLHGIDSIGLRLFSVYGPHERGKGKYANVITQMIWNDEFTIYGDGSQTRDFIYVGDVVRAVILAINQKGALILNIGTGKETSFKEVAGIIQKLKPLKIKYVPNPLKNYVQETVADISLAKSVLNWKPEIELEEGIRKTFEHYKKGGC